MTTGIEAGILDALLYHLSTYATTMPTAQPGIKYTPTENYLEPRVVPNTTAQVTLGDAGYNRHVGLMQIDVVWKLGVGAIAPAEVASGIAAHFKRGTNIARNGLTVRTGPPRVAQALPSDGWLRIPVVVPWSVDTLNPV